jgi:uncharacterized membrane protein YheB (UPF0754 family)
MNPPDILLLFAFPLIGAVIGWITNYIALKMLFHPRKPWPIPGLTIQGLLPRRRRDLAEKIGSTVAEDLLSAREISSLLGRIHWREEIDRIVHSVITRDLIPGKLLKLPGFDILLMQIQERITNRILEALDEHMDAIVDRFHRELDIREMIVEKLVSLDLDDLEKLIFRIVARELRHIELVGGVLGFVVGLVQSCIFYLSRH